MIEQIDPIDLTLFHNEDAPPNASWRMKDRLNGWTSLRRCRLLEWTGWYNYDIAQRLLGHYRLFHHFKADYFKTSHQLPAAMAYILDYRSRHGIKYLLARIVAFLVSLLDRIPYPVVEIAAVNRQLVNESTSILYDFLIDADRDFTAAFLQAMDQIKSPTFLSITAPHPQGPPVAFQYNDNRTSTMYNSQVHIQPTIREGATGKTKGVFSKRQLLMLFDLLAKQTTPLEKIDFSKPNRFDAIAGLLHAISGKSKASISEELKDYQKKGLYDGEPGGQRNQIIAELTNLADIFRAAGFRSIAREADRKIIELQKNGGD
jgi:hypothetical protein